MNVTAKFTCFQHNKNFVGFKCNCEVIFLCDALVKTNNSQFIYGNNTRGFWLGITPQVTAGRSLFQTEPNCIKVHLSLSIYTAGQVSSSSREHDGCVRGRTGLLGET